MLLKNRYYYNSKLKKHGYLEHLKKSFRLGYGSYASIYPSRINSNIAIKVVGYDPNYLHTIMEIEKEIIEATMWHNNLVTIYGFYTDPKKNYLYIVMKKLEGEDLFDKIANGNLPSPKVPFIRNTFKQVLQALDYLHGECGIIHMDVKPENIRILDDETAILYDFNLSEFTSIAEKKLKGTIEFCAPEIYDENDDIFKIDNINEKVDIWSLGMTLYTTIEGRLIIYDVTKSEASVIIRDWILKERRNILDKILEFQINTSKWKSEELLDMFFWMTEIIPSKRPSAKELLSHSFIVGESME